jgi:hypothetical protein
MTQRVAFNPTESPVIVDDDGHSIPGLDRGEVDTTSPYVQQAVDIGRLVWVEAPGGFDVNRGIDPILADVGQDPDKARQALRAENATAEPRPSLISKLRKVIEKGES